VHSDRFKPAQLPEPTPEEQEASRALSLRIEQHIKASGGTIGFADFMEHALYTPELGYYMSKTPKFGAGGDFITAPELSPMFGTCIAAFCRPVLAELRAQDAVILEAGAGSGALCLSILATLAQDGPLPSRYLILEKSPQLQAVQRAQLAQRPDLAALVEWVSEIPLSTHGVILANELLDALPCARFIVHEGMVRELGVGARHGAFHWAPLRDAPAGSERLAADVLDDGYTSELPLAAEHWLREAGARLAAGAMLLVDYGFPHHEYYHRDRSGGTLMCHYRHYAHADPLIQVGLQDITIHIDFTALAEAALTVDLNVRGYTNQAAFLLDLGLTRCIEAEPDERARRRRVHEAKILTLPSEMGELFKVMALRRGITTDLLGFGLLDLRSRL